VIVELSPAASIMETTNTTSTMVNNVLRTSTLSSLRQGDVLRPYNEGKRNFAPEAMKLC
jgi:hypothetical protein